MAHKLLCFLFGHRPAFVYARQEGAGYFRQEVGPTDGCGRIHIYLRCDCEWCGKDYQVGMIHWKTREEIKYK